MFTIVVRLMMEFKSSYRHKNLLLLSVQTYVCQTFWLLQPHGFHFCISQTKNLVRISRHHSLIMSFMLSERGAAPAKEGHMLQRLCGGGGVWQDDLVIRPSGVSSFNEMRYCQFFSPYTDFCFDEEYQHDFFLLIC